MKRILLSIWLFGSTFLLLLAQRGPIPHYRPYQIKPSASLRSDGFHLRLDSIISFQWKEIYVYDASGNPVRYTRYVYGFGSGQFEPYVQNEMQYDAQGRTKSLLVSYWDNTGKRWNKNNKEENLYGPKGTLDSTLLSNWDGSSWVITQKKRYAYNIRGQEEVSTTYLAKNTTWMPSARVQTLFDSLDRPIICLYDIWIDSTKSWKGDSHTSSHYDAKGNEVEFLNAFWNYQTQVWDTSYKETYTYDSHILSSEIRLPDQANWMYNSHNLLRSTTIYSRPGPWVENGMFDLYYSASYNPVITDIAQSATTNGFTIYPNPVSDVLQVQNLPTNAGASLVDANGNKVMDITSDRTDVSKLPVGVYLVRVEHNSAQEIKKVLKK